MIRCCKFVWIVSAVLFAVILAPANSKAETRNPFRDQPSLLHLIQEPGTQKRLKLADEQTAEIERIVGASADEPDAAKKQIEGLLTAEQKRLMRRLDLQLEGGYALSHERIAKHLELSDEQRGRLQEVIAANDEEHTIMRKTMMVARFASAEAMAKFVADYRDKADAALLEILSDEQSQKFKTLFAESDSKD